ncbi:unnamed protein product (mitochondrion) [Plasmodiophora brassicae]|uniref:Cysteine protease n=1 Tax=Plasmodiophora brassicae TaxID=37360 RepID=A0A3P3YKJ0_PLABS|nr:unnamed protein product [Plasmodiophora brassicae]
MWTGDWMGAASPAFNRVVSGLRSYFRVGQAADLDDADGGVVMMGAAGAVAVADARARVQDLIWLTYRRGFPPLPPPSRTTSDAGWGCMIRTGQMMLAHALQRHGADRRRVIGLFLDTPAAPFSIHRLVDACPDKQKAPDQWFGPLEVCRMMHACCRAAQGDLASVVCSDGLFRSDVEEAARGEGEPHDGWRPVVVLVPLRLGLDDLNPIYMESLLQMMTLPQSLGFIGGRPRSSLYFVGFQGRKLLYLDPHTIHDHVGDVTSADENVSTFCCRECRTMMIDQLDPCLALGFYVASADSLDDMWRRLQGMKSPTGFDIGDRAPVWHRPASDTQAEQETDDDDFVLL